MNRQLKFRVWDRINKEFINGFYIRNNIIIPLVINFHGLLSTSFYQNPHRIGDLGHGIQTINNQNDFIIQQFTGLTDKNGKEIYEGDIVKYFIKYNDGQVRYQCINEVKYNHGRFYPIPVNDIIDGDEWYSTYYEEYEVIGNIFENPELLK